MKKRVIPHTKHAGIALLSTLALVVGAFGGSTLLITLNDASFIALSNKAQQSAAALFPLPANISGDALTARAAVVYDPSDGRVLYAKNEHAALPLASITKLMTAEVVLTALNPDTIVRISKSALAPEGDSGFKLGDLVSLSDLISIGLIASSNDAMQAAAESLGTNYLTRMNEVSRNLGLESTTFVNPTGLDEADGSAGAVGSAYDVARIAALFYKQYPKDFLQTQEGSTTIVVSGRTIVGKSTSATLHSLPGLIGAKTGYTVLAGGNVVAVFDIEIGHPLVVVVLGSTKEGRFDDIKTLIQALRAKNNTN